MKKDKKFVNLFHENTKEVFEKKTYSNKNTLC